MSLEAASRTISSSWDDYFFKPSVVLVIPPDGSQKSEYPLPHGGAVAHCPDGRQVTGASVVDAYLRLIPVPDIDHAAAADRIRVHIDSGDICLTSSLRVSVCIACCQCFTQIDRDQSPIRRRRHRIDHVPRSIAMLAILQDRLIPVLDFAFNQLTAHGTVCFVSRAAHS